MGLVHLPPFFGCGGETSREQEPFVFAEGGDFSQKSFHALPFFFTSRNVWRMQILVNPAGFRFIRTRESMKKFATSRKKGACGTRDGRRRRAIPANWSELKT